MSDNDSERKAAEREFYKLANELRKVRGRPALDAPGTPAEAPFCSFCGKGKNHVRAFIEGPSANICDECVELCQDIVRAEKP